MSSNQCDPKFCYFKNCHSDSSNISSSIDSSNSCGNSCCSNCGGVSISSKILDEIDVFVWDFDLSLTRMHTIARNDQVISRGSSESRQPLMSANIGNINSEWYAGKWLINPNYFVDVVKTLVDVHHKKVAIATHHSYRYFENSTNADCLMLKSSGEKRKFPYKDEEDKEVSSDAEVEVTLEVKEVTVAGKNKDQLADNSGLIDNNQENRLLAGADFVLEYLRVAFDNKGEDVKRYFHQGNVVALDCLSHPGKIQHILKVLDGLELRDKKTGLISESLVTPIKANGYRYLRLAMFDDDPNNISSINKKIEKYVDTDSSIEEGSYDKDSSGGSYESKVIKIRGITLPTVRGGLFCDEALWLRGFVAFPKKQLDLVGFRDSTLNQLRVMLELEEIESSSSGEFIEDGYDSDEDL